ncbi:unnamed protein product [Rotaria socialis]
MYRERGNCLEYGIFQGENIIQQLNNMSKIDVIQRLFRRAAEENDGTRLIQAYTAETGIKILNQTFISTTRTRPIAEEYILDLNNGKNIK